MHEKRDTSLGPRIRSSVLRCAARQCCLTTCVSFAILKERWWVVDFDLLHRPREHQYTRRARARSFRQRLHPAIRFEARSADPYCSYPTSVGRVVSLNQHGAQRPIPIRFLQAIHHAASSPRPSLRFQPPAAAYPCEILRLALLYAKPRSSLGFGAKAMPRTVRVNSESVQKAGARLRHLARASNQKSPVKPGVVCCGQATDGRNTLVLPRE